MTGSPFSLHACSLDMPRGEQCKQRRRMGGRRPIKHEVRRFPDGTVPNSYVPEAEIQSPADSADSGALSPLGKDLAPRASCLPYLGHSSAALAVSWDSLAGCLVSKATKRLMHNYPRQLNPRAECPAPQFSNGCFEHHFGSRQTRVAPTRTAKFYRYHNG
jgi:hypothetical protein